MTAAKDSVEANDSISQAVSGTVEKIRSSAQHQKEDIDVAIRTVSELREAIQQIAIGAQNQAIHVGEMAKAVEDMNFQFESIARAAAGVSLSSGVVNQVAGSAERLALMAGELQEIIARFRV